MLGHAASNLVHIAGSKRIEQFEVGVDRQFLALGAPRNQRQVRFQQLEKRAQHRSEHWISGEFRDGKMKVRGDEEFGKRLLKHLASSEGKIDICSS